VNSTDFYDAEQKSIFTQSILDWSLSNPRNLPWKNTRDPYVIWLSEVILQQTRVEHGLPYFQRFLLRFPDVTTLAEAPIEAVLKLWEGLGYYSRARNLHQAARHIVQELGGRFPSDMSGIAGLKGVGPYSAAAIASFAFGLPYAVVDGNVSRVIARYFAIDLPIDSTQGKKRIAHLAQELLDPTQPGAYNQAIMDFGAIQCTPVKPLCTTCPITSHCFAFAKNIVQLLPKKQQKPERRTRYFHYIVPIWNGQTLLRTRSEKDIWQHLHEFPLIEKNQPDITIKQEIPELLKSIFSKPIRHSIRGTFGPLKQILTHQTIFATFHEVVLHESPPPTVSDFIFSERRTLEKFTFPKIIRLYIDQKNLHLESF
jgi:A/G-specific adenine glycosylase